MRLTKKQITNFQKTVYDYYETNKRDFPWRKKTNTPYEILVSEVMLQQTQADRVVPKYKKFVKAAPTFEALAKMSFNDIITLWQGLGYNRRALNLHKCAKIIVEEYNGQLPSNSEEMLKLPGIGPYTTAAVQVFAFNKQAIVIETNIRTVFILHFFKNTKKVADTDLVPLIEQTIDVQNPRKWYSALMDYGSHLKKTLGNASRQSKHYTKQNAFKGSNREARGAILRVLSQQSLTKQQLIRQCAITDERIAPALEQLIYENMIVKRKNRFSIPS